jgi:hypothetical protein
MTLGPLDRARERDARLRQLRDEVDRLIAPDPGSRLARQARRLYDVVADEVAAEAPMAELVRTAGNGLVLLGNRAGDLPWQLQATIAALLTSIERDTASAIAAPATATPTTPDAPATVTPVASQPTATEAAIDAEDPRHQGLAGTEGIGVPILPDD